MPHVSQLWHQLRTAIPAGKALQDCAEFSPPCIIACLIYINRLIAYSEVPLRQMIWRPLVLVSLLVAHKVWDEPYISNSDYAFTYPFFTID